MGLEKFIEQYALGPDSIHGPDCLNKLLLQMEAGLAGRGNIPMLPSYLSLDTQPEPNEACCVLDAGGTNLRIAQARFREDGSCVLSDLVKVPMPGTQGAMTADAFYETLAGYARQTGCSGKVGLCFSYNVLLERNLDGILLGWCKEVRVPDAPGKPVGASLAQAIGPDTQVRVLNDSTAALLGAHSQDSRITLGLILGTGINICYQERCHRIPKSPKDLTGEAMIISTEIGEFDGFPKTVFDSAVIAASDDPDLAHAEKQCAGAYLGQIISLAWNAAAEAGILPPVFRESMTLAAISDYLVGNGSLPRDPNAIRLAQVMIHRAAKLAAILTAGPILRSNPQDTCSLVIEGSQFHKLTGFAACFQTELESLLKPYRIRFQITAVENSCLLGAALAAFAQPM